MNNININRKTLLDIFHSDNDFINDDTYHQFYERFTSLEVEPIACQNDLFLRWKQEQVSDFLLTLFFRIYHGKTTLILDHNIKHSEDEINDINQKLKASHHKGHEKPSIILMTSGSSGKPKYVMYALNNLIKSANDTIEHYQIRKGEIWGASLPFNHIGGLMILIRTLILNSKLYLIDPSNITQDDIENTSYLSLVPTQLSKLINKGLDFKNTKGIVIGGAKQNIDDLKNFTDKGIKISTSYGMSETCAQIAATPFTNDLDILESVGRPFKDIKITLNKERISIHSNRLAIGYLGELPFKSFFQTFDRGIIYNKYHLKVLGRIDDIYISGGKNIDPQLISEKIKQHLKLKNSFTHPIEDDYFGEISVSHIELEDGEEIKSSYDIKDALSTNMAPYEIPKMFFHHKLKNESLKITHDDKEKLKDSAKKYKFLYDLKLNTIHAGNPHKKPLFIFHGFMGSLNEMKFFLRETYLTENFHLILIDLPGHGKSKLRDEQSFISFAKDFAANLDLIDQKIHMLGYSMGARFAYEISKNLKKPAIIILESGSIGIENEDLRKKRLDNDKSFMNKVSSKSEYIEFLEQWYKLPIFKGLNKDQVKELTNKRESNDIEAVKKACAYYSPAHQQFIKAEDIEVDHEYHYIYGEWDEKYKLVSSSFKHRYMIKRSSHNTHYMNKNSYLATVKDILTQEK